jgi:hypothetical protein
VIENKLVLLETYYPDGVKTVAAKVNPEGCSYPFWWLTAEYAPLFASYSLDGQEIVLVPDFSSQFWRRATPQQAQEAKARYCCPWPRDLRNAASRA